MKILVIAMLLGIVASLGRALFSMAAGPADDKHLAKPEGGYFLWVELAPHVDALEVHRRALAANISIAPGPMFSARREFSNCLRLNCGHPWTAAMDRAVAELGRIVRAVAK